AWKELLDDKKVPMPGAARALLTQEFDNYSSMEDLVLQTLEQGVAEINDEVGIEFSYSPLKRLVKLYDDAGRKEDAREFMMKNFKKAEVLDYDPEYSAYRSLTNLIGMADEMLRMSYP